MAKKKSKVSKTKEAAAKPSCCPTCGTCPTCGQPKQLPVVTAPPVVLPIYIPAPAPAPSYPGITGPIWIAPNFGPTLPGPPFYPTWLPGTIGPLGSTITYAAAESSVTTKFIH